MGGEEKALPTAITGITSDSQERGPRAMVSHVMWILTITLPERHCVAWFTGEETERFI